MFIELIWSNQPSLSSIIIPTHLQYSFLIISSAPAYHFISPPTFIHLLDEKSKSFVLAIFSDNIFALNQLIKCERSSFMLLYRVLTFLHEAKMVVSSAKTLHFECYSWVYH